jgi:hypothetical protein
MNLRTVVGAGILETVCEGARRYQVLQCTPFREAIPACPTGPRDRHVDSVIEEHPLPIAVDWKHIDEGYRVVVALGQGTIGLSLRTTAKKQQVCIPAFSWDPPVSLGPTSLLECI